MKKKHTKEELLHDRLRHATFNYETEQRARITARLLFAEFEIIIVHSPHPDNPNGKAYWIDEPGIVRSWETVLYQGLGNDA